MVCPPEQMMHAMNDAEQYHKHRIECLLIGLCESSSALQPKEEELAQLLQRPRNRERVDRLLCAGEAYCAAGEIAERFPGPALLLYGAAVNALAEGPDVPLRGQIKEAEKAIARVRKELLSAKNLKATFRAAYQKAAFGKVCEQMRLEFGRGLLEGGYRTDEAERLAKEIVDATHRVRHEAHIDEHRGKVLVEAGGKLTSFDSDEIRNGVRVGNGPVRGIFPFVYRPFRHLLRPAKIGCASTIASHFHTRMGDVGGT